MGLPEKESAMRSPIPFPFVFSVAVLLAALTPLAGCDDDPLAPFEPEISNETDSFSLQATGVRGVTLTRDYLWRNTGTSANVNQATTVTGGSARLTILDDRGDVLYFGSLSGNGTFSTESGESGGWTIRVALDDYSGTTNFSAEKP